MAGVHSGCFELFAHQSIRSVLELKGKSVGVQGLGSIPHVFLAVMATYVGLDPVNDVKWISSPSVRPKELFAAGQIDAFLGFPPEPQELRARNIGHVILNSASIGHGRSTFAALRRQPRLHPRASIATKA